MGVIDMSKLFEVSLLNSQGTFDVTPFIVLNSYEVSIQPVYKEWVDANGKYRKGVKRTQLKGSFNVKFFNQKDYNDFFNALENNKVQGTDYLTANVYDNKSRALLSSKSVYISYEPANVEPSVGWSFNEEISIEVEER